MASPWPGLLKSKRRFERILKPESVRLFLQGAATAKAGSQELALPPLDCKSRQSNFAVASYGEVHASGKVCVIHEPPSCRLDSLGRWAGIRLVNLVQDPLSG